MRTLLVIAPTNALTEAIRAAVDTARISRNPGQAGLRGDELLAQWCDHRMPAWSMWT